MFSASDFRFFAEECLTSARAAKSDELRRHFMDLAKMWTAARAGGGDSVSQIAQVVNEER